MRADRPNATISAIAKEAGVSKETIYAIFGSKVTLIGEMVKASVAKSVPGKHFLDEERPRAIRAETDQARQIELWATYLSEIMERVSPLMAVIRSGSEVEPEMGELYRALHKGRRANLGVLAGSIFEPGEAAKWSVCRGNDGYSLAARQPRNVSPVIHRRRIFHRAIC